MLSNLNQQAKCYSSNCLEIHVPFSIYSTKFEQKILDKENYVMRFLLDSEDIFDNLRLSKCANLKIENSANERKSSSRQNQKNAGCKRKEFSISDLEWENALEMVEILMQKEKAFKADGEQVAPSICRFCILNSYELIRVTERQNCRVVEKWQKISIHANGQ